jgi:hypothetical protein
MQGHLTGQGEEDGVSPRGSYNGEGGDAARVAGSRGSVSSSVDSGGSDEFLEHEKREEGVRN